MEQQDTNDIIRNDTDEDISGIDVVKVNIPDRHEQYVRDFFGCLFINTYSVY